MRERSVIVEIPRYLKNLLLLAPGSICRLRTIGWSELAFNKRRTNAYVCQGTGTG